MPVPIIYLETTLRQYVETFRKGFTLPQFQHFVTVLLGLIFAPERRTLAGPRSQAAGTPALSALNRLFSEAPWSPEKVGEAWLSRFRQQLVPQIQGEHPRRPAQQPRRRGRPNPTQVTAFAIFDDTLIDKHPQGDPGRRIAGIGNHYTSSAAQVEEGPQLGSGLAGTPGSTLSPATDAPVAQVEGVPFPSKVDLVVRAISTLMPVPGTRTYIPVDAWYTCRKVWRAALKLDSLITGGLRTNRWLRLPDSLHPGWQEKVRLSAYKAELEPKEFMMVPWRGRLVAAHLVGTFVYKLGACQVLVVKETKEAPPQTARCWASSDLKGDVVTVASDAAQRWDIEVWIEDVNELLGLC